MASDEASPKLPDFEDPEWNATRKKLEKAATFTALALIEFSGADEITIPDPEVGIELAIKRTRVLQS